MSLQIWYFWCVTRLPINEAIWEHYLDLTSDKFVVSCDVLGPGYTYSLGVDEGSNSLCVRAIADHLALLDYDRVDISIHLSIYKGDVINQVYSSVTDGFDWCWSTAEYSCERVQRERERLG